MSGYAAASPLALGGPPDWVAWAVVGTALTVGTFVVGKEVYDAVTENGEADAQTGTGAVSQTGTRACETCGRPYSVRVHAQGTDCGGTARSTIGAPPLTRTGSPITAAEGLGVSAATWGMLAPRQKRVRSQAKTRLDTFILARPPAGFLGLRSFPAKDPSGGKRYDVDSFGPANNFVA